MKRNTLSGIFVGVAVLLLAGVLVLPYFRNYLIIRSSEKAHRSYSASKTKNDRDAADSEDPIDGIDIGDRANPPKESSEGIKAGQPDELVVNAPSMPDEVIIGEDISHTGAETTPQSTDDTEASAPDAGVDRFGRKRYFVQVTGQVATAEGEPVPGAIIRLQTDDYDAWNTGTASVDQFGASSDENGDYHLTMTMIGGEVKATLFLLPPRDLPYSSPSPQSFMVTRNGLYENKNFVLNVGVKLIGLVIDQDDNPVEGADIRLSRRVHGNSSMNTKTDSGGAFWFGYFEPEEIVRRVEVSHPEFRREEREDVTPSDGLQIFRLERKIPLIIHATDARHGHPIDFLEISGRRDYRVDDTYVNVVDAPILEGENGRFEWLGLYPGTWFIDFAEVLGNNGGTQPPHTKTGLVGNKTVVIAPEANEVEVYVTLGQTGMVRGRVVHVDAETGTEIEPLPGAELRMYPDRGQLIELEVETTSDENGDFLYNNVEPGSYIIEATKGSYASQGAVKVEVAASTEPPDIVTVPMTSGGVVWGTVTGEDGNPLRDIKLHIQYQRANGMGWDLGGTAYTNADGLYRFEGVPAGAHKLAANIPSNDLNRVVHLELGAEIREDFSLSGKVQLDGTVYFNGQPAFGKIEYLMLYNTATTYLGGPVEVSSESLFSIQADPGNNIPLVAPLMGSAEAQGQYANINIAAQPAVQDFDLHLNTGVLDLLITYPEGDPFQSGLVYIRPVEGYAREHTFDRFQMGQETKRLPHVWVNDYTLTFTSSDRKWSGSSEVVNITPGSETAVEIRVYNTSTETRVGGWASGELSNVEWRTLSWDVSSAYGATSPGATVDIWLQYDAGYHAAEAAWVRLVGGTGAELARDEHPSWTGGDNWGNHYYLQVPAAFSPPLTVEAQMRTDGGVDSTGSVYWISANE